jgi:hypothetical protein
MGRRSSLHLVNAAMLDAINAQLDAGYSLDQVVTYVTGMGGEVSRSALGRHKLARDRTLNRLREAQTAAKDWLEVLKVEPGSDVGQLLAEMLKVLAFKTLSEREDADAPSDPKDIMMLARALQSLASADSTRQKLIDFAVARAKAEAAAEAAAVVDEVAAGGGLSKEVVGRLKAGFLSVRSAA